MQASQFQHTKTIVQYQRWIAVYLCFALECDTPILEALFWTPPSFILDEYRNRFYDLCYDGKFAAANKMWSLIARFQIIDWRWIRHQLTREEDIRRRGTSSTFSLVEYPQAFTLWNDINKRKLTDNGKIATFLSETAQIAKPKQGVVWGSFVRGRDGSPERH